MSAINPIVQTPPRLNPDQFNTGAGQTGAPAAQQGFSETLNSVGPKPVRKSASGKSSHSTGSGDTLPVAGNTSPPATPSASGATANTAATNPATMGTAPVATPPANAAPTVAPPVGAPAPGVTSAAAAAAAAAMPDAAVPPDALGTPGSAPAVSNDQEAAASAATQAAALASTEPTPAAATADAAAAAAPAATAAGPAAAPANSASTDKAPASPVAAKSTNANALEGPAGRGAAAMRAIYPTGNSGATSAGKSSGPSQESGSAPTPEGSAATTAPPTQVDTAAMVSAMQANTPAAAPAAAATEPPAPASPADPAASPVGLPAANGDAPTALPALAAAAASAAQVVSTIAAGAAADKKSHDTQSQIASTSAASSASDAAGAAQLLNAPGSTHTDSGAVPTFKVNAAVDSPEFGQNVTTHVSTMLDGNVNSAKLQVNPPALGPIEVRIAIQGDHAQVWMASHSAMTRDALQDAAPQLREMLNSQGFAQVSVDISQRSFQERTPMAHAYEWNGDAKAASAATSDGTVGVTSRTSSGVLDAYA